MVVLAPLSGRLIRIFGGRTALMAGAAVMIVGYVGRVFFSGSIAWVIIGSAVVGVGTAIAFAAMPTLIMGAVPITETAAANGLNSLVCAIGTSTSSAAIAAVFTSVTIAVGNTRLPSFDAFRDLFWLAALASAASMLAAVFIPRAAGVHRPPVSATSAAELVLQGRVLAPDHRPLAPAVVTVLQTDGQPVDWSRVNVEGNYSVALPGAGRYLMVANAAGWAPMTEVFDFDERSLQQNFFLRDRLKIGGTVSAGRKPVAGAVVTLQEAGGGHVGTTRTDEDGGYAFPLPAPGRYLITMLHPATHAAMAQKLAVDNCSMTLDFAAPTVR
ncbi:MFS transporter [Paenarthrobacter aurescens]|uniref:MFS transporter n=1 Tax=Paenarthrobacter aurescens TaxID=43663 RepID=UPI0035EEB6D3